MQLLSNGPATTLTRSSELAERLRVDICTNALPPGTRITEEGLAERYGVSRTPVREALRILTRESLLDHRPHAGYSVARISLDEMDDLYSVRVSVEEQVAARVAAAADQDGLDLLLSFWERVPAPSLPNANLVFDDERFHEGLAAASGSLVFPDLLRNINQRLHVLRVRDFVDGQRVRRTFEQHAAILHALRARDARLASALLRAHIWESHSFVRASALAAEGGAP